MMKLILQVIVFIGLKLYEVFKYPFIVIVGLTGLTFLGIPCSKFFNWLESFTDKPDYIMNLSFDSFTIFIHIMSVVCFIFLVLCFLSIVYGLYFLIKNISFIKLLPEALKDICIPLLKWLKSNWKNAGKIVDRLNKVR